MNRILHTTTLYLLTADAVQMGNLKSRHLAKSTKGLMQLRKPATLVRTAAYLKLK